MIFSGKSIKSVANKFLNKLLLSTDETVEVKTDVWKSMYPFFCNQALSTPVVAIESLKILDVLIDCGIVGDYKNLQKVLLHKSDKVAYLALDVLRKIKGLAIVSAESGVESTEKVPQRINQQVNEIERLVQKDKDIQSRIFNVLKKEDSIAEKRTYLEEKAEEPGQKTSEVPSNLMQDYDTKFKDIEELKKSVDSNIVNENAPVEKVVAEKLTDVEKKVEEPCQKISEAPSNLAQDYDTKFKALQGNVEELKKLMDSNIVSGNALVEQDVAEKLTNIEEKIEELCQRISEVPSNLTHDYDTKFKALQGNVEELKKLMDSNIVSGNALVEQAVAEKLKNIEEKIEELCQRISEVPSNLTQDYDTKFKALQGNLEELKKLMDSNIVSENALVEQAVTEKLTNIEEKIEELCQKILEVPSNLTQDYDTKFKALQGNLEELKKLMDSNIVNENAMVEKVAGQILESIKPDGHIPKSEISSISQLAQKKAEDSQRSAEQGVRLHFLDNTPETSIVLLNWVKFLLEKVGRNKLSDILEYYVEIGWISEEISSAMADYANGIDYYVEPPTGNLLPEVHTKSLLFIEQLRRRKMDKKHSSFSTSGYGSIIPTHSL